MKIEAYIKHLSGQVNSFIRKVVSFGNKKVDSAVAYAVFSGGKRLRPALFLVTLESLGKKINQDALRVAAALEFVHVFSLIQDDLPLMDNDDYRRGRLTAHKVFGEDIALLASDALLNRAYALICRDSAFSAELKSKILSELAVAVNNLIAGQADDLDLVRKKKIPAGRLNDIYMAKTGALLSACVKIAGIIKGLNAAELKKLGSFGNKLGLVYQISDDLLNVSCDKKTFKGRLLSDKKRGKLTYLSMFGRDKALDISDGLINGAIREIKNIPMDKGRLLELCFFILKRKY